uniref:Uncharacterized protein n=1 Tax=Sphaerodactylus townsendi TaxID=933632 RepID=A0ACB8F1M0_9SAUR
MVTRESDADGMSALGEDVPGSGREKSRARAQVLSGAQRAFFCRMAGAPKKLYAASTGYVESFDSTAEKTTSKIRSWRGSSKSQGRERKASRGSMDSDISLKGDQAALPATEEDGCLVNLGVSHPGLPSVDTGEWEDILDEPPDPPDPPGATSSRHGDVETPDEDLDAFTLHAQHEALQRAKRDWQQAREALIDDRVHQRLQLRQEFEWEREALYLQLQKDCEQQGQDLLQAAEQSKQELL